MAQRRDQRRGARRRDVVGQRAGAAEQPGLDRVVEATVFGGELGQGSVEKRLGSTKPLGIAGSASEHRERLGHRPVILSRTVGVMGNAFVGRAFEPLVGEVHVDEVFRSALRHAEPIGLVEDQGASDER